jgi:histidyl-tRNA synthetase
VGIEKGQYIVKVNNRKVLNGVMEVAGVLDPSDPEKFATERGIVLRAIDKLDRLGVEGVRALLGEGRKDESGDFAKGAGLSGEQIERIMGFVCAKTHIETALRTQATRTAAVGFGQNPAWSLLANSRTENSLFASETVLARFNSLNCEYLLELVRGSEVGEQGVSELVEMEAMLGGQGYKAGRVRIDPAVVRGLGYYTGPVFEAELTFTIPDEKGRPRQFGSVAGGGRYDDLVKRFTGQSVPATGVSIGVDRLLAALRAKGLSQAATPGPVIVTVMDRDRMADYMAMAAELRAAGIRAEVYLGNPKSFGNQLKYADKRASPVAVIQGSSEAEAGTVILKDLALGAQIAQSATLEEWKDRPAQREVPRADLVAEVRRMLG